MSREQPARIGPYRILRKLGEGGMGVVYEAMNDDIERRVAIKCLNQQYASDEEATRRFFNEARAANRINHPSIVQISDHSTGDGSTPYIVMEFLDGQTLAAVLHQHQAPLQLASTLAITWQIATALAAAHDKNIIHRDLKPENVMLVSDPVAPGKTRVKLLDFGVAKLASSSASKTGASVIMGTPRYMSPEQCKGSGQVDDRADCYALGVMLFEMLSGRLPFLGEGAGELIAQHMYKEPPSLRSLAPQFPLQVLDLVERLLRKTPSERPAMADVSTILERLLDDSSSVGERASRQLAVLSGKVGGDTAMTAPQQRSSTLRGELSDSGRSSALIGGLGVLGILLLLGAGAIVRGLYRGPQNATGVPRPASASADAIQAPVPPSPSRNAELRKVKWLIRSRPEGAKVIAPNGATLGMTPLTLEQLAESGTTTLTLRLPGHSDRELVLNRSETRHVTETLQPLPNRGPRAKRDRKRSDLIESAQPTRRTSYED